MLNEVCAVCPDAEASSKREREAPSDKPQCAFCHEGEDSDDPDEDPIVEVEATGRAKPTFAHDQCLWWCPDITQADDMSWQNVGSALRRCARLKCAVCGETHAPLGCKRKACKKSWHYPCAMEPTTGLVVYEDEFCVACPICHEVMERRERKKRMESEAKKATKDAAKAAAASEKAAAKAASAASKKAAVASSAALPPATVQARVNAASGGKAKAATAAAPKVKPPPAAAAASKKPGGPPTALAPSAVPSAAPPRSAFAAPAAPAAPPPPPPPPPPDPKLVAAEAAIAKLFKDQRCEDLPLEMVKQAAGLPDAELEQLLKKMDDENKLMCRAGSVYLI